LDNGKIARDVNGSELFSGFWGHRKNLRSFYACRSRRWTNRPKIHEKPSCKRSSLPVLFSCKRVSCVTLVDGCCQAGVYRRVFISEVRVIKNGAACKHSPLFSFNSAYGSFARPSGRLGPNIPYIILRAGFNLLLCNMDLSLEED
jgi:hypothetical protein